MISAGRGERNAEARTSERQGLPSGRAAYRQRSALAERVKRKLDERPRSLLGQPHRVELVVQVVARGDGPAAHLREMRHDAVPLEGHDVVHLLVVEPLLA